MSVVFYKASSLVMAGVIFVVTKVYAGSLHAEKP